MLTDVNFFQKSYVFQEPATLNSWSLSGTISVTPYDADGMINFSSSTATFGKSEFPVGSAKLHLKNPVFFHFTVRIL